jgi:S-formylglutathione hydrolase
MKIETLSETNCFRGRIGFYKHASEANHCDMRFSVFVPPQAAAGPVPVVTFLSGLTCTEENFMIKSGAQRVAAELGVMLVSPDTSPRGESVPDDPDGDYDFGLGAGFYLNATEMPWSRHYNMYDYVTRELQAAVFDNFPGDPGRHGLMGHSMGGHGAFVVGLRNPDLFRSLSAFALGPQGARPLPRQRRRDLERIRRQRGGTRGDGCRPLGDDSRRPGQGRPVPRRTAAPGAAGEGLCRERPRPRAAVP